MYLKLYLGAFTAKVASKILHFLSVLSTYRINGLVNRFVHKQSHLISFYVESSNYLALHQGILGSLHVTIIHIIFRVSSRCRVDVLAS